MLLSKCAVYDSKKSEFIKEQEASGLLSTLKKASLSKIFLAGPNQFQRYLQANGTYEMNEIVHNFLLAEDKFMPVIHLRPPGFTYSACEPLKKAK